MSRLTRGSKRDGRRRVELPVRYDLYLSYSGRRTYRSCPRKYRFQYVTKEPVVSDPRSSFFGSAIGKIFEWFYSDMLWTKSDPVAECNSRIDRAIEWAFKKERWEPARDPSVHSQLKGELRNFIPRSVEIIRTNGFLTPYSQAEIDLTVFHTDKKTGLTLKMGGRADFIHGKSEKELFIIDGKASSWRDKFVDSDQLIWYAAQHYIKYHIVPVRLGFMFWRFPEDPLMWINYGAKDIQQLVDSTFELASGILSGSFDPRPSHDCKLCDYSSKCPEGTQHLKQLEAIQVESKRIQSSIFLLEDITSTFGETR